MPLYRAGQVFFRVALAILKLSESKLLERDLEAIMTYLSRFPKGGAAVLQKDVLVPVALNIKVIENLVCRGRGGRGGTELVWCGLLLLTQFVLFWA